MARMNLNIIHQRMTGFFAKEDEGYDVYKKIKKKYGEDTPICVSQHPALGDAYLAGLYLNRCYQKKYVVTAMGKGSADVYKYLGIKNICLLTEHETNSLIRFCHFIGMPQEEVRILHHQALLWNTGIAWNLQGLNDTTFADLFEAVVFPGLSRADRIYPSVILTSEMEKMWKNVGIEKGRSVILFPKTNTLSSPPKQFWEKLVRKLSEKYSVIATYSESENECLTGTRKIYSDISALPGLAQYAGTIIGARNGLMDILSIADCKKIILYPQMGTEDWINGKPLNYWSVNNFGYCSDAAELEWNEKNLSEIMERVVSEC